MRYHRGGTRTYRRGLFGTSADVRQRYEQRYVPGQELYLSDARPESRATVVVDNNDPARPTLVRTAVT